MADTLKARRKLQELKKLSSRLNNDLLQKAADVAIVTARAGERVQVSGTEPGKVHKRTGETRRQIRVETTGRGSRVLIGSSEGAPFVERGRIGIFQLQNVKVNWATGRVTGLPGVKKTTDGPRNIGRSGIRYKIPGPFISPAAVAAGQYLKDQFYAEISRINKS